MVKIEAKVKRNTKRQVNNNAKVKDGTEKWIVKSGDREPQRHDYLSSAVSHAVRPRSCAMRWGTMVPISQPTGADVFLLVGSFSDAILSPK